MKQISVKQTVLYLIAILCPLFVICALNLYCINYFDSGLKLAIIITPIVFSASILLAYTFGKIKLYKILAICNVLIAMFGVMYMWLIGNDLLYIFSSVTQFKNFILATGHAGVVVYIAIQILQVVVLPIPAAVICISGALIYGPFFGAMYCSIGVIIGSIISFWLGRVFGCRLVSWVVGRQNAIKYASVLTSKGKSFLPLAFLLPLFPDDILCLIAGITDMKFDYFIFVTIVFRPISVVFMALFGSGYIIPFRGAWLYLWGVIIVLMVVCVYLVTKNQNKIEQWIVLKLRHKK